MTINSIKKLLNCLIHMYENMQYANILPQQICVFELVLRALYILGYACWMEHTCICKRVCMWSACGRLCVTMVILNKAYRERERNWGAGLSLALHQLGILTRQLSSRILLIVTSHVLKSLFPLFRAAFTHFLSTAKSHLQSYLLTQAIKHRILMFYCFLFLPLQ